MIQTLWDSITSAMAAIGWMLDDKTGEGLRERGYSIWLPGDARDTDASVYVKARVIRDVRLRLQFRERRDTRFQLAIAQDVENVVTALRATGLFVFEAWGQEERQGGIIAEVRFSARDSMS